MKIVGVIINMAKALQTGMARTLDGSSEADTPFEVRIRLEHTDAEIAKMLASGDFTDNYRTFMWTAFDGTLYMRAEDSEILTPEGFDSHPLFHANEMLARSKDYASHDDSAYSAEENPVALLGSEDESKEFNEWLGRHTLTARLTSVYPKLTIVRRGDLVEFNYLDTEKMPRKSNVHINDYAYGMKSFAQKVNDWAHAVKLPCGHPPFEELYWNAMTALSLKE